MKWLVMLTALFAALPAEGQRYLAGMRGVQAMGGLIEGNGYYLHGGYSWYTENKNRWAGDVEYLHQRHAWEAGDIPLAQFTAEFGFYRLLFCDVSKSFLSP
jgi:hypothetical protein